MPAHEETYHQHWGVVKDTTQIVKDTTLITKNTTPNVPVCTGSRKFNYGHFYP
jgi:hypothetical protein